MQSLWEKIEGVFLKLSVNAVLGQCSSGDYISEGATEVCMIEVVNFVTSVCHCSEYRLQFVCEYTSISSGHYVSDGTAPAPSVNINGGKLNNQLTLGLPLELHSHKCHHCTGTMSNSKPVRNVLLWKSLR